MEESEGEWRRAEESGGKWRRVEVWRGGGAGACTEKTVSGESGLPVCGVSQCVGSLSFPRMLPPSSMEQAEDELQSGVTQLSAD
jgi:hypothetical protein